MQVQPIVYLIVMFYPFNFPFFMGILARPIILVEEDLLIPK